MTTRIKPTTTAVAKSEARKRARGYQKLWLWAHPDDRVAIRAMARKLYQLREAYNEEKDHTVPD